eukprot:6376593-Lingulodinium_polyedra.AAC.1
MGLWSSPGAGRRLPLLARGGSTSAGQLWTWATPTVGNHWFTPGPRAAGGGQSSGYVLTRTYALTALGGMGRSSLSPGALVPRPCKRGQPKRRCN